MVMSERSNLFDIIRHVAALLVLVSHHFELSGRAEPLHGSFYTLGSIAVICFFSISGYLITLSFLRSSSVKDYMLKRCARNFPALVVCAFLMVFPAQMIFAGQIVLGGLFSIENLQKFIQISLMGRATLDQVTAGFIFPDSFNGSLWTLKIEFFCYVMFC